MIKYRELIAPNIIHKSLMNIEVTIFRSNTKTLKLILTHAKNSYKIF